MVQNLEYPASFLAQIHVRLLYGEDEHFVQALVLLADKIRPEQHFRGPKSE
jgi:hypothetical protein